MARAMAGTAAMICHTLAPPCASREVRLSVKNSEKARIVEGSTMRNASMT